MRDLPRDLIESVFLRLPVSTLLRCIGVCKQWHKIIRDPQFVTSHLQHAPCCALLFFPQEKVKGKPYPSDAIIIDESWSHSKWAVPVVGPGDFLCGSCNGLVCLYTNTSTIKIANLATGECLHLEKPEKNLTGDHFSYYSFGFHPMKKEYKVTHFVPDRCKSRSRAEDSFSVIQVYTLGDVKWKDVGTPEALSLSCVKKSGLVNVDGTLYWLTKDKGANWQHAVMSFDLSKDNFARIHLPAVALEDCALYGPRQYWVKEIDGKVCIATSQVNRYRRVLAGKIQIWTLDNKVEQRWSQKYNTQSPAYIPGPNFVHRDMILVQCREKNLYSSELLGRNFEVKLSKKVKLLNFSPRKPDNMQSYIFVKSLVRLDAYKKASIVHRPKQREGWELKTWEARERKRCKREDSWKDIQQKEQDFHEYLQCFARQINVLLQRRPGEEILQLISIELNKLLQHLPDCPDQHPRSLRHLNWVEQKHDKDKLNARVDALKDTMEARKEALGNISRMMTSYGLDQGTSSYTVGTSGHDGNGDFQTELSAILCSLRRRNEIERPV